MGFLRDLRDLVKELKEERRENRQMVIEVLRTSQQQAEAMSRVVGVVEGMMKAFDVSGLPSTERHLSEEGEALMLEDLYYGDRDGRDGDDRGNASRSFSTSPRIP